MFRKGEDFGAVEGDDMVADGGNRLGGEVVVVYSEMRIEPVHFVGNEFAGNEALQSRVT